MRYGLLVAALMLILIAGAALILGNGNSALPTEPGPRTLLNSEGPVAVSLSYPDEKTNSEYIDYIAFKVSMNTHSVNLDEYNMEDISYIRDSNNEKYFPSK
ncbi:hypothetical protein [Methanolobus chelungpuianus]|uniref:Uncharacterized protein n=1 Tax=Methanolobus chelungpuianus TaxID=502115 RepID=A0AAE3HCF3_9EURY|nr:hypothetical protein [Methanolobus chelungpuianus]MCQ6963657.1 hypothetical protein [Methanolobus chelungpuianus]